MCIFKGYKTDPMQVSRELQKLCSARGDREVQANGVGFVAFYVMGSFSLLRLLIRVSFVARNVNKHS